MLLNQVFQSAESKRRFRVVYESIDGLIVVDIDDPSPWPISVQTDELTEPVYKEVKDPFPAPVVEAGSTAASRRDEALAAIKPLLDNYPQLFDKRQRNRLIKEVLSTSNKPRLYIIRQLQRYWQRGMTPNALAPDYYKSGGRGKARRSVRQKLGRKRSITPGEGVVVTEDVADLFRLAIDGFYLKNDKVSLVAAKDKAVGFYRSRFPEADETQVPTLAQFRYFFERNYLASEVARKRIPSRTYEKDNRALFSTAGSKNFGPGARYEIDATIADIYLVSEQDPQKIIGRPVMYFVKDVFSRMVVGMYVGLENASWVAAMMALANAMTDKTAFCKGYGIDISLEDWPAIGIPDGVMADRGELLYRQADVLVNRFGIQLSTSRAYRGDDKGIVERHFNTIQGQFRPHVTGVVEPVNGKKRIGRRYELDATLNLRDFSKMLIHLVINYNNSHPVDRFDYAPDMPENLAPIPLELWNWGIKNRTGRLRPCKDEQVWVNLLPYEEGLVSELGIRFRGLIYTCQEALKAGWFDRIRQNRPSKVEVAYDPRSTNTIFVRPDKESDTYWECVLSDRSRRFQGMSFVDAAGIQKAMKRTGALARQRANYTKPDTFDMVDSIVSEAKGRQEKKPKVPDSQRLRGIRQNRSDEREIERSRRTHQRQTNTTKPAEVVTIRPQLQNPEDSLDYPSLDDLLDDDDD